MAGTAAGEVHPYMPADQHMQLTERGIICSKNSFVIEDLHTQHHYLSLVHFQVYFDQDTATLLIHFYVSFAQIFSPFAPSANSI